jgi:hypothetical protein
MRTGNNNINNINNSHDSHDSHNINQTRLWDARPCE